jgi:hypothetical protein
VHRREHAQQVQQGDAEGERADCHRGRRRR